MVGGAGTATYQWYASASTDTTAKWVEIEGEDDATLSVTASLKDKFIKVVVTDEAGNEAEDETLTKVGVDASFDVELVDDYGLQSDGTGIIGDRLTVTYGSTFGVPQNITWYKDGKVVLTRSIGDLVTNALTRTITASEWGTGVYKVTITNTDGAMAETNEIEITDKEEAAKILDFTLEDDYTDGTDVNYGVTDHRAVATVKMSKNYSGRFRVYKATDVKYASELTNDRLSTSIATPGLTAAQATDAATANVTVGTTAFTVPLTGTSILTTNQATNYQVLNAYTTAAATDRLGSGYGYIDNDGTVTYKWVIDTTGVTRGDDYVVCFDQNSISTDTPGTGTANVSAKATAPYVTAPAKIAVTKVARGTNPEITFQDAEGNALNWFGYRNPAALTNADSNAVAADGSTTLAQTQVQEAKVFRSTNKTTDTKASGVSQHDADTTDNVVAGVWTDQTVGTGDAYWFAYAKLAKGVYGKEAIELTSEAVPNAQDAATDIDLVESKTTATTAVVKFTNLRASGTVYVVRGWFVENNQTAGWDVNRGTTAANIFAGFTNEERPANVTSIKVDAGAASVEVPNAIGDYSHSRLAANTTTTDGIYDSNTYIAVFVPDDQTNYGMVYTDGTTGSDSYTEFAAAAGVVDKSWLTIGQELTSFDKTGMTTAIAGTGANTGTITFTGIQAKDQFGDNWASTGVAARTTDVVKVDVINTTTTKVEAATGASSLAVNGIETLTLTLAEDIDKGDGFTASVANLANLTITVKAKGDVALTANTVTMDGTQQNTGTDPTTNDQSKAVLSIS